MVTSILSDAVNKGYEWYQGPSTIAMQSSEGTSKDITSNSTTWERATESLHGAATTVTGVLSTYRPSVVDWSTLRDSWPLSSNSNDDMSPGSDQMPSNPRSRSYSNNYASGSSGGKSSWLESMAVTFGTAIQNPYRRLRGQDFQQHSSIADVRKLLPLVISDIYTTAPSPYYHDEPLGMPESVSTMSLLPPAVGTTTFQRGSTPTTKEADSKPRSSTPIMRRSPSAISSATMDEVLEESHDPQTRLFSTGLQRPSAEFDPYDDLEIRRQKSTSFKEVPTGLLPAAGAGLEGSLLSEHSSSQNYQRTHSDNFITPPARYRPRSSIGIRKGKTVHQCSETASHLAEGTVRALRDLALEEAVDLHAALRYWSYRWEHPLIAWLEAGPTVWWSPKGYSHQRVGQKVAQIQAVLARRCAAIGELQQHLLQAGWQRGVAQWAVLGQGHQWATVRGSIMTGDGLDRNQNRYSTAAVSQRGYYTNVLVSHEENGAILMEASALAEWSIDAMLLIRSQLYRSSLGKVQLPFENNWLTDQEQHAGQEIILASEEPGLCIDHTPPYDLDASNLVQKQVSHQSSSRPFPKWAETHRRVSTGTMDENNHHIEDGVEEETVISDLGLMAEEVSELLTSIEEVMAIQRARRLGRLKPRMWLRRNWYLIAASSPLASYVLYQVLWKQEYGLELIKIALSKIATFFRERVQIPVVSIVKEVWKGREFISDDKARTEVITSLKTMIWNWLEEFHPELPKKERLRMAENMDISLIERQKTESMKTILELNHAIRSGFIEMQFIKKEMVNTLHAMDEMMSANDINMNLAAVTPAVLVLYTAKQAFRTVYYALLKLGTSREETYASFRHVLTDVERLLVMRDNPPSSLKDSYAPAAASNSNSPTNMARAQEANQYRKQQHPSNVLSADDLGMLMLHIHECRTILRRDRSRFSPGLIRAVSEDLAELAGERGAVSVQQQLQIIGRMSRTYPFLKVISTGVTRVNLYAFDNYNA